MPWNREKESILYYYTDSIPTFCGIDSALIQFRRSLTLSGRSFGVESPDPAEVDGVEGVGGVVVVGDEVEEALVLVLRIQSKFGINI